MIFTGTFNTYDNEQKYSVTIGKTGTTQNIVDPTEDIWGTGAPAMKVMFAPDPVNITCDREDLVKRIIISQAKVSLVSNQDLSSYLFANTNRDIPVTIQLVGNPNQHVFFGYVDPLQFNQGYAHNWEDVQVNATDPLGALEDSIVDPDHLTINPYNELSPWTIITTILDEIGVDSITESINATVKSTMQSTKINCSLFFGESQDDWLSYYDVLDNICKYFNLYIAMNGVSSVIITSTIDNTVTAVNLAAFKNIATDDSTSLSIDDAYSQVSLTCEIEPEADLISSFDDKDLMYSDYDDYVKYMTEYVSTGEGKTAWGAFYDSINGRPTDYDAAFTIDHWCYVFRNDAWDFGSNSYIEYLGGSINHSTGATTPMTNDQRSVLTWLAEQPFRAALIGFAPMNKVMLNGNVKDNSLEKTPALDKCLIISTMGHLNDDENDSSRDFSRYNTLINSMTNPICTYRGLDSSVLSPANNKVVNFIVISGNITLNPLQLKTGPYTNTNSQKLNNNWTICKAYMGWDDGDRRLYGNKYTVPYPDVDDGAYYNQFWHYDGNESSLTSGAEGVYGYLNNSLNKDMKYEMSQSGNYDTISKLPILCCQLSVTHTEMQKDENDEDIEVTITKYCVERLDGGTAIHQWTGMTGQNRFEWLTQDEIDTYNSTHQSNQISAVFTIGIDPKIDDYIIGQKFAISNSVDWRYNLDKTGMAIPIHNEDRLSGTIEFKIISPYNAQWDTYRCIFPFGWIVANGIYRVGSMSVLGHTQSIMLSDLKIEMTSNNGGINRNKSGADNDLVYYSDMNAKYIEKQEDSVKICSCLDVQEHSDYGIKIQNSNSWLMNSDNTGFFGWATGNTDNPWVRPEECYVDYMYKEYSTPAKIIDTQINAESLPDGLYGNALNYDMLCNYITGIPLVGNCRIMSYDTNLKYKTIDCKFRQHMTVINQQLPHA